MNIVMHVDANSAYLSWTAVDMLKRGCETDIREIPAVIGGDKESRHGIVLAKSHPAKKYRIVTGESLYEARKKCPNLAVFPPDYYLYEEFSNEMYRILLEYSPVVQRYSIDECYIDCSRSVKTEEGAEKMAYEIQAQILEELGFTVNIGISTNMLLAKMGSELEKPNKVHTLYPREITEKMWPLPVGDLYMVGRATVNKLKEVNINTIGDLARADHAYIRILLKKHGDIVWNYANGIDPTQVLPSESMKQKGIGHSTTTPRDITEEEDALVVLLAMTEKSATGLRKLGRKASVISVNLKNSKFISYSKQIKLSAHTDSTDQIYNCVCSLFREVWKGEPLRLLGVQLTGFDENQEEQISFFATADKGKTDAFDSVVDRVRSKYGDKALTRGSLTPHVDAKGRSKKTDK